MTDLIQPNDLTPAEPSGQPAIRFNKAPTQSGTRLAAYDRINVVARYTGDLLQDLEVYQDNPDRFDPVALSLGDTDEPYTIESIMSMGVRLQRRLEAQDSVQKNPYHNANHTRDVCDRTLELMNHNQFRITKGEMAVLAMATPFDNYGPDVKGFHDELWGKEFAAVAAQRVAKEVGFTPPQRVEVLDCVLSTEMGLTNESAMAPQSRPARLLAAANLGGVIQPNETFLDEAAAVLAEQPEKARPATVQEWVDYEQQFLDYVEDTFDDGLIPDHWRKAVQDKQDLVQTMKTVAKPDLDTPYALLTDRQKDCRNFVRHTIRPMTTQQRYVPLEDNTPVETGGVSP